MPIIAVVGNKGGAGKTTLSVNLASGIARQASIAVIDADPQGSATHWGLVSDRSEALPVFEAQDDLDEQVAALSRDYEHVVIDCPPSVHAPQTGSALAAGDVAIIPVQPSPMDLWATVHIEQAVVKAQQVNPSLSALLVINQLESRTMLSRLMRDVVTEIGLPVAATALKRRAIYRSSALEGKSVYEMGKRGHDAATEVNELIQEIMKHGSQ